MMYSPRELLQLKRERTKTMVIAPLEQYYDVQDEEGVWRIGYCQRSQQKYKVILMDGFHPCHTTFYCDHSGMILPIRTKTMALTVPEGKTIRRILTFKQIEQISGKLSLFLLRSNQLENTADSIRLVIRTELLIIIDKIFNTPIEIFNTIKMVDLHINKFFINVIEYYFKLLESSKKFINVLDSNESAKQLFRSTYEMAHIIQMILGVHKRSKAFYESTMNRTVTCGGFLDCFIKSQVGINPFKLFLKNLTSLKSIEPNDMTICLQTVYLFISMCQKYQKQFLEGNIQTMTKVIVEEIINLIRVACQRSQEVAKILKQKIDLISRIQSLYFKLYPNKQCALRKIIEGEKDKDKDKQREKLIAQLQIQKKGKNQEKQNQRIKQLEIKLDQLETTIQKLQTINLHQENITVLEQNNKLPNQTCQNFGEEAFLSSLQWALDAGDVQTCKKLITWRKSLLKLGRIAGWQIALSVGMRTFKKKTITPDDIIEANYDFILKQQKQIKQKE